MGFLDALLGRTKPVPPNLDELFALPNAALTLEAGTDFRPTGSGSVCFRAAEGMVTDLHAVNSSLEAGGFGPQLLCTIMAFRDSGGRSLGLVYLYKRGTFYPFAQMSGQRRDNSLELQIRGALGADLKIEPDLARWMPIWGAPGL